MDMHDVGIVMPVYKQKPSFLRAALRSVLGQSYKGIFLQVVIDGAPLEIVRIVSEEIEGDERAAIIVKRKNEGVAKALNTGFEKLKLLHGIQYLTWVSSDNFYYPDFISRLRDELLRQPAEVGIVYSSFRQIDSNGVSKQTDKALARSRMAQQKPKEALLDVCFIGVSFMYKKHYASMIGGYDLEPVEDYDYWLRLAEKCDIHFVPEELMDYRVDSFHSVSAQLKQSKEHHRRWRYAFNLVRHRARKRRGIPFETTVIYPIREDLENTLADYEKLLDLSVFPPFYSNYKIVIIHCSTNLSDVAELKKIPDPRVSFLSARSDDNAAIQQAVRESDTPFIMVYGEGGAFPSSPNVFYRMVQKLRQNSRFSLGEEIISIGERQRGAIELRISRAPGEPVFGELYRAEKLKGTLTK
jgi:glycosyltransferase involved in cell wall biosynthesis